MDVAAPYQATHADHAALDVGTVQGHAMWRRCCSPDTLLSEIDFIPVCSLDGEEREERWSLQSDTGPTTRPESARARLASTLSTDLERPEGLSDFAAMLANHTFFTSFKSDTARRNPRINNIGELRKVLGREKCRGNTPDIPKCKKSTVAAKRNLKPTGLLDESDAELLAKEMERVACELAQEREAEIHMKKTEAAERRQSAAPVNFLTLLVSTRGLDPEDKAQSIDECRQTTALHEAHAVKAQIQASNDTQVKAYAKLVSSADVFQGKKPRSDVSRNALRNKIVPKLRVSRQKHIKLRLGEIPSVHRETLKHASASAMKVLDVQRAFQSSGPPPLHNSETPFNNSARGSVIDEVSDVDLQTPRGSVNSETPINVSARGSVVAVGGRRFGSLLGEQLNLQKRASVVQPHLRTFQHSDSLDSNASCVSDMGEMEPGESFRGGVRASLFSFAGGALEAVHVPRGSIVHGKAPRFSVSGIEEGHKRGSLLSVGGEDHFQRRTTLGPKRESISVGSEEQHFQKRTTLSTNLEGFANTNRMHFKRSSTMNSSYSSVSNCLSDYDDDDEEESPGGFTTSEGAASCGASSAGDPEPDPDLPTLVAPPLLFVTMEEKFKMVEIPGIRLRFGTQPGQILHGCFENTVSTARRELETKAEALGLVLDDLDFVNSQRATHADFMEALSRKLAQRRKRAVLIIEANWRAKELRQSKEMRELRRKHAASKLQSWWLGHCAFVLRARERARLALQRKHASIKLQALGRGFTVRRRLQDSLERQKQLRRLVQDLDTISAQFKVIPILQLVRLQAIARGAITIRRLRREAADAAAAAIAAAEARDEELEALESDAWTESVEVDVLMSEQDSFEVRSSRQTRGSQAPMVCGSLPGTTPLSRCSQIGSCGQRPLKKMSVQREDGHASRASTRAASDRLSCGLSSRPTTTSPTLPSSTPWEGCGGFTPSPPPGARHARAPQRPHTSCSEVKSPATQRRSQSSCSERSPLQNRRFKYNGHHYSPSWPRSAALQRYEPTAWAPMRSSTPGTEGAADTIAGLAPRYMRASGV